MPSSTDSLLHGTWLVTGGPRAANHFTDVKMRQARDIF